MPTYEYECEKCGHQFEKFQSMTDEPVKRCPECRCKVMKLISAGAGLLFKGSGFYVTDYRSDSYKAAEIKDKKPSTSGKTTSKKTKSSSSGSSSKTKGKKAKGK